MGEFVAILIVLVLFLGFILILEGSIKPMEIMRMVFDRRKGDPRQIQAIDEQLQALIERIESLERRQEQLEEVTDFDTRLLKGRRE